LIWVDKVWVDKWVQPIVRQDTLMKTIHLLSDSKAELILEFFFPLGSDALTKPLIVTGSCFFVKKYNGISLVCQEKKGYMPRKCIDEKDSLCYIVIHYEYTNHKNTR
jgi:hypothetical protein